MMRQAAELLKRYPETVRDWVIAGVLKGKKERGRYVVQRSVVEAYIASIPNVKRRRCPVF